MDFVGGGDLKGRIKEGIGMLTMQKDFAFLTSDEAFDLRVNKLRITFE